MATIADKPVQPSGGVTAFIDKWIYVLMAAWVMGIVLIAFIPNSVGMVMAIGTGMAPPIPPILHVHAVLMGGWLLLLLAQSWLMATGHKGMHMQLGMIGFVLMPAIVIAGFLLVPVRVTQLHEFLLVAPPEVAEQLRQVLPVVNNIKLGQIRIGVIFPLLVGLALYLRTRDSETHKRLLILATLSPLPAAFDRMGYLPTTMPASPLSWDLTILAVGAPMLLWDLYRQKRLPRAYAIWAVVMVITAIPQYMLWDSSWWAEVGPRLTGQG